MTTEMGPAGVRVSWRWSRGAWVEFKYTYRNGQTFTLRVDEKTGFVTQQQAAMILGVSLVRVNEWVRYERIAGSRNIGGQSMIPLRAVRAIYEKRKRDGLI